MLQPYHSKSFPQGLSHPLRETLPTGNNFGGSNLITLPSKIFSPTEIVSNFVSIGRKSSELLIQLLSLILVTIWFWCLLGAVNIALRWGKKIDTITVHKPVRATFMGTLTS
jgi:hypothetical protein